MATGTPEPPALAGQKPAGHPLAGLAPALHRVARLRWLLCLVGAAQSAATVMNGAIQPADLVRFAAAGDLIVHGRLDRVYADPWMQAGPLELLASWAFFPFDHQHVRRYVVTGPDGQIWLRLLTGAAIVAAVLLAVRCLRSTLDLPRSAPAELLAGLTAVLLAVPYQFWMGGHLAQTGAPVMWVAGACLVVRGRTTSAGLVLGLATGWEPWGLLAGGILLAERAPARLLAGCAALTVGALACYLPFVVTGQFAMFGLDWQIRPGTPVHALFPGLTGFGWPLRLLQGAAAGAAGAATALLLGRRRDLVWAAPLAVLVVRLLLDPLILSYYWGPFLIAVVAGLGLLHPHCSPVRVALTISLAAVPLIRFRYAPGLEVPLLLAALVLLAALTLRLRREETVAPQGITQPAARLV
ncbi:hypothetical protein KIH74_01305 [Kineosporia sp. J2-2]|uniref:DUF2029 domain-containing protein n=1 Tax=Kineosporia corallincola TaxID=2835133 RepID=A0ABS5T8Z3_9ACTN|nr:hypothetical protein [Kineosporia corallincola]MBT0767540.1 hypothetical protein [Kineosporia corallincola]